MMKKEGKKVHYTNVIKLNGWKERGTTRETKKWLTWWVLLQNIPSKLNKVMLKIYKKIKCICKGKNNESKKKKKKGKVKQSKI